VAAELNEAMRRFNQGQFEDASNICNRILSDDPDNLGALNILGGCLARTGKVAQAIKAAERVCFLSPGNAAFYSNLSYLHSVAGNFPKAILVMAHAIMNDTRNTAYQTQFARLVDQLEFYKATAETAAIKEAIKICMANPAIDVASFATAWHSLLLLDPVFIRLATLTQDGDFKEQAEKVDIDELAGPLADPFLLLGLKSLHAIDLRFERIMTFFRRFFLSRLDDYDSALFLPFICALAEHCNLNEYVYSCTQEEQTIIDALDGKWDLSAKLDASAMARIALVSCYKDLAQTENADLIEEAGGISQTAAFMHLVESTISNPRKAREYYEAIPAISSSNDSVQNVVSSSVAKQYEENPYPRWRHLDIPVLTEKQRSRGRGKKILIAGCGTGYEPLNLAVLYPEAHITAIDLSVPSLAYGKQKAVEFGIKNIEFMQADILQLENLGQQFDLVSCVGVLHHMQDPVEGWRKLLTCLKPDGLMKIALYSEIARESVVLCRNWINEQGFASTPEGIRDFRQAIMDLDDTNPLKDIVNWTDFFSMSMCRDLAFHVQEHNVTLPWIKSVLDDLGLSCLSMRISNPLFRKEYLSMYPDDPALTNLDNLHDYEKHNPRTFRDMYQFWCCRKGSVTVERPPEWFYTTNLL
jgi:2-polyprenyl-3-methyl-5-hydroxy-6-metoxy-1,4-benzoquinol methylase